jgi:hypothetical protein
MGTKYDYVSLKSQYVQGTMSMRELCRTNDIPTWSTVQVRANREGWDALRAEFQRQVDNRSIIHLAQKRANKAAEIENDLLEVIHAGILKMATDMDAREPVMDGMGVLRDENGDIVWRPVQRFGPNQLQTLVGQYLAISGKPTQIAENRNLNANLEAKLETDDLRALLAAVRPRAALAGAGGADQAGDPPRTRSN